MYLSSSTYPQSHHTRRNSYLFQDNSNVLPLVHGKLLKLGASDSTNLGWHSSSFVSHIVLRTSVLDYETTMRSLFVESHLRAETISRKPIITLDATRSGFVGVFTIVATRNVVLLAVCFVVYAKCVVLLLLRLLCSSSSSMLLVRSVCGGRDEW